MVTVDGAIHAQRAFGDAAEPVLLHQGEVEILIAFGFSAETDGWGRGRWGWEEGSCRDTRTFSTLLRGLVIITLKIYGGNYISEGRMS